MNRLGSFLALTPTMPEAELSAFAGLCVRAFEPFRAPLSDTDIERRRKSGLTPKQDGYLTGWGYPYIFDEFRFHMTLSNKLEDEAQAAVLKDAAETFFRARDRRLPADRHVRSLYRGRARRTVRHQEDFSSDRQRAALRIIRP